MFQDELSLRIRDMGLRDDTPTQILLVKDNENARLAILTWPKVDISYSGNIFAMNSLAEMWLCCSPNLITWHQLCGVSLRELRSIFLMLKGNAILYPDGSISEIVLGYIRKIAMEELKKSGLLKKEPELKVEPKVVAE